MLREHELDALVTPSYQPAIPIDLVNAEVFAGSCSSPTAIAGYPLVSVPSELAAGLPVAVSFWGMIPRRRRNLSAVPLTAGPPPPQPGH